MMDDMHALREFHAGRGTLTPRQAIAAAFDAQERALEYLKAIPPEQWPPEVSELAREVRAALKNAVTVLRMIKAHTP